MFFSSCRPARCPTAGRASPWVGTTDAETNGTSNLRVPSSGLIIILIPGPLLHHLAEILQIISLRILTGGGDRWRPSGNSLRRDWHNGAADEQPGEGPAHNTLLAGTTYSGVLQILAIPPGSNVLSSRTLGGSSATWRSSLWPNFTQHSRCQLAGLRDAQAWRVVCGFPTTVGRLPSRWYHARICRHIYLPGPGHATVGDMGQAMTAALLPRLGYFAEPRHLVSPFHRLAMGNA